MSLFSASFIFEPGIMANRQAVDPSDYGLPMETWDAIRSRRNVRSFKDDPLPPEALDRILEAGRRAPSSMNDQPWDFVLVTGRDRLRNLATVWRHGAHVAASAATVALVRPTPAHREDGESTAFDLGQASMSMMIAAADLGIGSCHSAVGDQDLARELLGLPGDRECLILISLGFPADRPLGPIEHPRRRPANEVVHRDSW
jgi:nitroreductase